MKFILKPLGDGIESASKSLVAPDERIVTIRSKRLLAAIERNAGDIDTTIMDLVLKWMGDYQDPRLAANWNMRHATYGSNGTRSLTKKRMERWMGAGPLKRWEKE